MLAEAHPSIAHGSTVCTTSTTSSTKPVSALLITKELNAQESVAGDDPEQNVTEDCALWGALRIFLLTFLFIFLDTSQVL